MQFKDSHIPVSTICNHLYYPHNQTDEILQMKKKKFY